MKLSDFVSQTLTELIDGVKKAQRYGREQGAEINANIASGIVREQKRLPSQTGGVIEFIEFDIAVTSSEGEQTQGGVGVFVGPIGLGAKGKSESQNSSVNRIKFSVPIAFPPNEES